MTKVASFDNCPSSSAENELQEWDLKAITHRAKRCSKYLRFGGLLPAFKTILDEVLDEYRLQLNLSPTDKSIERVVCYGLTHLDYREGHLQSIYQYCFLKEIVHHLGRPEVYIYGSTFNSSDKLFFRRNSINVAAKEDALAMRITTRTLLYVPKRDYHFLDTLMKNNWSAEILASMIIVGDDLDDEESAPELSDFSYIAKSNPFVRPLFCTPDWWFADKLAESIYIFDKVDLEMEIGSASQD